MKDLFIGMDWIELFQAIWTIVLVPIFTWTGKELHDWAKSKKISKYTDLLYEAVEKVVKEMYQSIVGNIKGTDEWTPEKMKEIKELAKTKIIAALSTDGYSFLKTINQDFDDYVGSLIEAALYDLKTCKDRKIL